MAAQGDSGVCSMCRGRSGRGRGGFIYKEECSFKGQVYKVIKPISLSLPILSSSFLHLSSPTQAESTDQASDVTTPPAPSLRVTRPSITSSDSDSIIASVDEDFTRLAKARSNPDILRTTLKNDDITGI